MTMRSRLFSALFTVSMLTACGTSPDASTEDVGPVAQPPGAPTGFMAMEMGGGAHLMWNDTFSNETGFELQRKEAEGEYATLITLEANVDNHHDGTPLAGHSYSYRVRALSAAGAGAWSAEASFDAPAPAAPGKPTNVSSMPMGGGVHVLWRDNTSDETAFEIERHDETGNFAQVHSSEANATYWMDMATPAGHSYTYRVRALTPAGATDWSNETTTSM